MRGYLCDENIPRRLQFSSALPIIDSRQAVGPGKPDDALWQYATEHRLAILTKDADFSDRIAVNTAPPWIIHLRFGNMRRSEFHKMLAQCWPRIEALLPIHKLICVYADRIEAFR